MEVTFWVRISVLKNQGAWNQAAFAKGQRKNRCKSVSGSPQRQQHFSMCFEYLEALFPEGIVRLRIRQMKVFTLGIISFDFQT
jgi:hypothetical protein